MNTEELIKLTKANHIHSAYEMDSEKEIFFKSLKKKIFESIDFSGLSYDERVEKVKSSTWKIIDELLSDQFKSIVLSSSEKNEMQEKILQVMFGYGVIEPFINDESITEIMINGTDYIFYEKQGKIHVMKDSKGQPITFRTDQEIMHVIDKIVAPINRKVDQSNPIVDARLPNGSRVNIVIPPAALDGPVVTIRKFPESPYTMDHLIEFGALSKEVAAFLEALVKARYNIIVSGGTGSGKTTFLNALSSYIPNDQRIITVEDSAELKITQIDNLIRLETRPPNIEGKGEITIRDLVKTALRMRPDRIVVGEVRGAEALDMLQAMNTGHDGSLTTGHANSSADMLSRIETMVMMAGLELPLLSVRQQMASAVDLIVFLRKMPDGSRKLDEIVEVTGIKDNQVQLNVIGKLKRKESAFILEFDPYKLQNRDKLMYSNDESFILRGEEKCTC
ncbi:MAG: CpaF family protein [Clostridia bacterium]|nr:CpaF family protein [Clostridia bacterium]